MPSDNKSNQISWRLTDKEKANEKREIIKYQTKRLGRSKEAAERSADIWIKAVDQAAEEFGED